MENWTDIKNYEGLYQVSDKGRIKSLSRVVPHKKKGTQTILEKVLTPGISKGYYYVILCKNGDKAFHQVHILVATYFVPNPYSKPVVNHKDANKLNCEALNLEWTTELENKHHAREMGLLAKKLTVANVKEIRRLRKFYTEKSLSQMFNVDQRTITDVINYRTWAHVQ